MFTFEELLEIQAEAELNPIRDVASRLVKGAYELSRQDAIDTMEKFVVDFRYMSAYEALCRLVEIFGANVIIAATGK